MAPSLVRFGRVTLLAALVGVLAACQPERQSGADRGPTAECSVCRANADLACLNVKITDTTERVVYNGKTYYFCSPECRAEFEKAPAKFAAR